MRLIFLLFPFILWSFAKPLIIRGAATFSKPAENILEIWSNDTAVFLWEDFIIKEGEVIHFRGVENTILAKGFCRIDGLLEGNGNLIVEMDDFVLGETGAIRADALFLSMTGTGEFRGRMSAEKSILLEGANIEIQKPLILNSSALCQIRADQNCHISSILGNLQRGHISLSAGKKVVLQGSPHSTAQIFTQGGGIEIEAYDLFLEGSGTPAEILSLSGDVVVRLERDLILAGGMGGIADVFARIAGQNIILDVKRDALLMGGDGARSMSELCAQNFLKARIGRDLKIRGGISRDRSFACMTGFESVDVDVLGDVLLTSGSGDSVQISSRWGSLAMEIGGSLFLHGNPQGGSARIKSYESLHISSPMEVQLENGSIFSRKGNLFLKAATIGADLGSTLSAPSAISLIGNQISLQQTKIQVHPEKG